MPPSKSVSILTEHLDKGDILDLGCGEGRNALFLAEKGFKVLGVDKSDKSISIMLDRAQQIRKKTGKELQLSGLNIDILTYYVNENFDAVICMNILHFFDKKDIIKVVKNIKNSTKINGFNVIDVFTEDNPYKNLPYLFKKEELKELYKDWKILKYEEYISEPEKHGDSDWHVHGKASLIARKIK